MPAYRVFIEGRNLPGKPWGEPARSYGFCTTRWVEAATASEATLAAVGAVRAEYAEMFVSAAEFGLAPEILPEPAELLDEMPAEFPTSGATWFPMDES